MDEELWTCSQVIEYLGIKLNNLRQIQHRGTIKWVKKVGKEVFYSADQVIAYKIKRDERNQAQHLAMFIIEADVTIAEIDDALGYISLELNTDVAGNRLNWKKRQTLLSSADDLLDERLSRMGRPVTAE